MATNGKFGFRLLKGVMLFMLPLTGVSYGGSSSARIRSLAIAPDGKVIAVDFGKGNTSFIYRVSVDTGIATRLTDAKSGAESGPAFSPDGRQIAFSYWPGNGAHSSIVIGNIDGSDLHPWAPSEANDSWPVFSSDNKTIVFSRWRFYGNYSSIAQPQPHAWSFYASDLDGRNVREITSESFYMASPASVSSDGKSVAMVTEGIDTSRQIAIYSLDRIGQPILSFRPHVPNEADHNDLLLDDPNYLADGKSILFMAASSGKLGHGYDYDIYRMDIRTGALERLTKGNGFATDLRVSADGKTAVFLKWRSDWQGTPVKNELYVLDVQTHELTLLKVTDLN